MLVLSPGGNGRRMVEVAMDVHVRFLIFWKNTKITELVFDSFRGLCCSTMVHLSVFWFIVLAPGSLRSHSTHAHTTYRASHIERQREIERSELMDYIITIQLSSQSCAFTYTEVQRTTMHQHHQSSWCLCLGAQKVAQPVCWDSTDIITTVVGANERMSLCSHGWNIYLSKNCPD